MGFFFRKLTLLLGDILLLYGSLFLALFLGFWQEFEPSIFFQHVLPFSLLYVLWVIVFYVMDLYDLTLPPTSSPFLSRFWVALMILFVTGIVYFYALSFWEITPKTNLLIHVLTFGVLSYAWRFLFSSKISALVPWRVGLYGLGDHQEPLRSIIDSHKHHGYESIIFDGQRSLASQIEGHHPHVVILPSLAVNDQGRVQSLYDCLGMSVTFLDVSQAYEFFSRRIPLSTVDQQWFIRNLQEKERGLYRHVKRIFDLAAASLLLVVTSPLWVLFALAIKLEDHGDVFYTQERVGKHGKIFLIKKFRTMGIDAERAGVQWAQKADPRVTRVGQFLRASHLDELPQMLNVIRGDISLVGPRPERPEFVGILEGQIPHYRVRHFIKPGFTGWAQIKFRYARSVSDSQKKFEYDLYYIKNRSFILDVLILLKTIQLVFRG